METRVTLSIANATRGHKHIVALLVACPNFVPRPSSPPLLWYDAAVFARYNLVG